MTDTVTPVYESAFAIAVNGRQGALGDARQISHDTVIANTGAARVSGVAWSYCPLRIWRQKWAELGIDPDSTDPDVATNARTLSILQVGMHHGILVTATVQVDPDVAP